MLGMVISIKHWSRSMQYRGFIRLIVAGRFLPQWGTPGVHTVQCAQFCGKNPPECTILVSFKTISGEASAQSRH